ncbi:FtsX-like permease family protein [Modicisalibacter xianhensis]|uniref:Putative ABC transport system permease protein n=1 Tax=Modicisalibacter xianhensis TaxID=442341 RepID=A0A1I3EZ61_9GAMM|nr:ABC transporter permease [Halomonas xianhensis]SFI04216.1 putative ABC transport system permease protein [Halomonas xianhensis]
MMPGIGNTGLLRTTWLTLFSHYRRHPGQLAMLLLGLWVASALWSGVQAINASARDSYARAEALFSASLDSVTRRDNQPLSLEDYLALRRAGMPVSPLVEGELSLSGETTLRVIGIDPLTLPGESSLARQQSDASALRDWILPPYRARIAPEQAKAARDDPRLPPLEADPNLPPGTLVTDIGVAQRLLNVETLSRLVVAPGRALDLPPYLVRQLAAALASPGQLTDSFHLNLTAMGLLALIVGLFIVHAALGLALEQRLGMLRTLRALGVPGRTLVIALALELLAFGLLGAVLGIVSGVGLARLLLPDVAASLDALYDTDVASNLALPWYYWLGGLAVTLGGLFSAGLGMLWRASRLDILALGKAQAWRARLHRQLRLQVAVGAVLLGIAAWLGWRLGHQPAPQELALGFAMVAALLLGASLWLPSLLAGGLGLLSRRLHSRPHLQWALADLQLQLPRLQLPMMALLLALSANLGVGSMVGGFRLTFLDWLDQRLLADLYVRPSEVQHADVVAWLEGQDEVQVLLEARHAEAPLLNVEGQDTGRSLALFGITPAPVMRQSWPLLESATDREAAWQALAAGDAVFINEQLARRDGLAPGDTLRLRGPQGVVTPTIAAIYPDYGNPRGEAVLPASRLADQFAAPPGSLGVVLSPLPSRDVTRIQAALGERFGLSGDAVVDQRAVKHTATEVFERTFAITQALNALTLAVAGLALLTTLLAQAGARRAQLAPLWALGVSRRQLVGLQFGQLVSAAAGTALLAVPLGIGLAWALVSVINVAAFGWRLPLHVFPGQVAMTIVLAVVVAGLAALLPAWRLWRVPPRQLLQEFAAA